MLNSLFEELAKTSQKKRVRRLKNIFKPRKKVTRRKTTYAKPGQWDVPKLLEAVKKASIEVAPARLTAARYKKIRDREPQNWPSVSLICKKIGWSNAIRKATPRPPKEKSSGLCEDVLGQAPRDDLWYYLDLYQKLGLKTKRAYYNARRESPSVVPPYSALIKAFGSFTNYKKLMRLNSSQDQLSSLCRLVTKTGQWPPKKLIKASKIDLTKLKDIFGSERELKEFVLNLAEKKVN